MLEISSDFYKQTSIADEMKERKKEADFTRIIRESGVSVMSSVPASKNENSRNDEYFQQAIGISEKSVDTVARFASSLKPCLDEVTRRRELYKDNENGQVVVDAGIRTFVVDECKKKMRLLEQLKPHLENVGIRVQEIHKEMDYGFYDGNYEDDYNRVAADRLVTDFLRDLKPEDRLNALFGDIDPVSGPGGLLRAFFNMPMGVRLGLSGMPDDHSRKEIEKHLRIKMDLAVHGQDKMDLRDDLQKAWLEAGRVFDNAVSYVSNNTVSFLNSTTDIQKKVAAYKRDLEREGGLLSRVVEQLKL